MTQRGFGERLSLLEHATERSELRVPKAAGVPFVVAMVVCLAACSDSPSSDAGNKGIAAKPAGGTVEGPGAAQTSSPKRPQADGDLTCKGQAPYAVPGPYAPGVKTLNLDGLKVEVWYPATQGTQQGRRPASYDIRDWLAPKDAKKIPDGEAPVFVTSAYRDLPVAKGQKFPVVLFSHGLGGYRSQSSFLLAHLASWGMVVAAPDHSERGLAIVLEGDASKIQDKAPQQLRTVLKTLGTMGEKSGNDFSGVIDSKHVAVVAHSQGGAAASDLATDPGISSWVLLASPGFGEGPKGKPLLMMGGTEDAFAKVNTMEAAFAKQPEGKRYIQIQDAVHLSFTDICVIGEDRGGPLKIARDHGIEVPELAFSLVNDGCRKTAMPVREAWPVIEHFVTAQMRWTLGMDSKPTGMDDAAVECFAPKVEQFENQ